MFDNTGGLGPEPYMVKEVQPGTYRVQVHFFSDSRVAKLGPVTATLEIYTDFGGPQERMELRQVRLTKKGELREVGVLTFD